MPIARHSMWEEVGRMVRIPFSSTVLQRRRGYRRVLQHFSRIRLAPMIPLDKDGMRDLLELKNIALLYELWTFFGLVHEISAVLGRPPVQSGRLASDLFQTAFAAGGTFEWDPGVRLVYNQRFSRSRRGQRHSYSVPLIPDIALRIPDGPNAGLHLFDAKFRVQALTDVGLAADDKDADDEKARERAGSFKRADIWKMHAYRDAIPDARRCGSFTRAAVSVLWGSGGVGGWLAAGRLVRRRGCRGGGGSRRGSGGSGRRRGGGRWPRNGGREWQCAASDIGADAPGVEQECQLHHTLSDVKFTFFDRSTNDRCPLGTCLALDQAMAGCGSAKEGGRPTRRPGSPGGVLRTRG